MSCTQYTVELVNNSACIGMRSKDKETERGSLSGRFADTESIFSVSK